MLKNLVRTLASTAALGLMLGATACHNGNFSINDEEGVPLGQLDLTGTAPTEVAMLGPDTVVLKRGDTLAITMDGEQSAQDDVRFSLSEGKLGIARKNWKSGNGPVTVTVTMPVPRRLVMAGSGKIVSEGLGGEDAGVTIAGTGSIAAGTIDTPSLSVDVAGSGTVTGAGKAAALKLTVAGSGNADLDGLTVDSAKIDVMGSGKARFASDGNVRANIMGSGEVRVRGRATCKVNAMGSGTLKCENAATAAPSDEASENAG